MHQALQRDAVTLAGKAAAFGKDFCKALPLPCPSFPRRISLLTQS